MNELPYSSLLITAAFLLAVGTTLFGALLAALSTRIVRGVCGLMLCCIGLAGLYYFLHSPFLALMEILIYVGAVCVTIIFGVMLSEPAEPPPEQPTVARRVWGLLAVALGAVIAFALAWLAIRAPWPVPAAPRADGSIAAIGVSLLSTYSLAFEVISLVLLVAIMGALVIARPGRSRR